MMDKHTDIIIWIVKDNIFLGNLTHITNFHQYTVFVTSRKKGRRVTFQKNLREKRKLTDHRHGPSSHLPSGILPKHLAVS